MLEQDAPVSGPKKQSHAFCRVKEILRNSKEAESRDLESASKIICSSERRTSERWRHMLAAIKKVSAPCPRLEAVC